MTKNRNIGGLILAGCLVAGIARAQSPIGLTIDTKAHGTAIPSDFTGLSFESSNLVPDKEGKYLFSAENKELINLFRVVGIKNLRVGGGTADGPEFRIPGPADIDQLFAFARAADLKVIYTLRMLNGNMANAAAIASYIDQHYRTQLCCFQIGNEPDWHSYHTSPGHARDPHIVEATPDMPGSAYPSYIVYWNEFAATITKAVPNARFTGPDTGSNYPVPGTKDTDYNGKSWTQQFAHDEKSSGLVSFVAHHDYVGESATGVSVPTAIEAMLSTDWISNRYPLLYDHVLEPVRADGFSYRMTECNDYTGGVSGASNAFVSALWALDYMYWHASHQAVGINFHNKSWIYTDTIYRDPYGGFQINPKAYAIKAFDLGSKGSVEPITISNPDGVNLTAYAVRGKKELFVTIINKEHGAAAHDANVTIVAPGISGRTEGVFLTAPNGDLAARTGITLGGAPIANESWDGRWTKLKQCKDNKTTVKVAAASAVVLRLALK